MTTKKKKESAKNNKEKPARDYNLNLSDGTKQSIVVIVLFVFGVFFSLALLDLAGSLGLGFAGFLRLILGNTAFLMPLLLFVLAIFLVRQDKHELVETHGYMRVFLGAALFLVCALGFIHILMMLKGGVSAFDLANLGNGGGYLGALIAWPASKYLGNIAGTLIVLALSVIGVMISFDIGFMNLFHKPKNEDSEEIIQPKSKQLNIKSMDEAGFVKEEALDSQRKEAKDKASQENKLEIKIPQSEGKSSLQIQVASKSNKQWKLPPFDLLEENKTQVDSGNIEKNVEILQKTLLNFGIQVEMGEVNVGPTVTQYTLRPDTGVRLSQIASLQNDLALALSAQTLRMELPIPGKPLVGIEVPNKVKATVRIREVMQTSEFTSHKSRLAIALGRDVAGHPSITDLTKMPHLLVAGATGTGKSVAINTLFVSLLYRNTPDDVKFIVIDPKKVELSMFNGIPHLLTPVITEKEKAVNALRWAVNEMDRRYTLLEAAQNKNIDEYNKHTDEPLPYIVVLVDELAELMQSAKQEVEDCIVRLAQLARAVGIHLVLATQRPSTDVITGLIKANIPARIAFAVPSQIDSRTILDSGGAESLLGKGDMLFISVDMPKPKRIQGALIEESEVKRVTQFFKDQNGSPIYNTAVTEKQRVTKHGSDTALGAGGDDDDELLVLAEEEVVRAGKASSSFLQRRLKVGYARAARLLDLLEERGVVGPGEGAKPREVYGVSQAEKAEFGISDQE